MTTISATPNTSEGTVQLTVGGLDVLGARIGGGTTWDQVADGWIPDTSETVVSDTAGDPYGTNIQMVWTKNTSTYASVSLNKSGTVGAYYAFSFKVRLDTFDKDLATLDPPPPLEVWLDTTAGKPWGEDRLSRKVIWPRDADGPDPYAYEELWLFYQQANAADKLYLRFRPLWGHVTNAVLYFRDFRLFNNAANPRRTYPRIWRTDANGRRELALDYMPTISPVTQWYGPVVDREAALTGSITYEVSDTSGADGVIDVSATTTLGGNALTTPRLSSNVDAVNVPVDMILDYAAARPYATTVHRPIGRSSPVVIPGAAGAREGSVDLFCTDRASALALLEALADGTERILRQASIAGLDLRFVPLETSERPFLDSQGRWGVTCRYAEVD